MTTTNDRTRDRFGKLLEETGIAIPIFPTAWDYKSRPPYRVQRHDENDDPMAVDCWDAAEIELALGAYVWAALPEQAGLTVVLLDEGFRVILGYVSSYGGLEGAGAADWFGTAECFNLLSAWGGCNKVDLAIWESLARGKRGTT